MENNTQVPENFSTLNERFDQNPEQASNQILKRDDFEDGYDFFPDFSF